MVEDVLIDIRYQKIQHHAASLLYFHLLALLLGALFLGASSKPAGAAPSIFWVSDPINPGETVLLTGAGLAKIEKILISLVPNTADKEMSESTPKELIEPTQRNDQSLKFTLPHSMERGVYRFNLMGPDGNAVGYLNEPTVYWVQGDHGTSATPGGWIRVFGRNIGRTPKAQLALTDDGRRRILTPDHFDLWNASFKVPLDLITGTYTLALWNGEGDRSTWRKVGVLSVRSQNLSRSPTINARAAGAVGDGHHDDTRALNTALDVLHQRGGGTLLLPRGRYLLSGTLNIPTHVTLRGQARELVSLNWLDMKDPPPALIEGHSDFTVEDLTLYASNYSSVISGGISASDDVNDGMPPKDIRIKNVLIRASAYRGHITPEQALQRYKNGRKDRSLNGPVTIQLSGENISIIDSDIYGSGSPFYLFRPQHALIARNTFYNGRGWYSITGADGVIFEGNKIIGGDTQSTGGGINTLSRDTAFSQNVYFARNSFSLMHGWDREAITSDGPGGFYYGHVKANNATHLALTSADGLQKATSRTWIGAGFFIIAGTGVGQFGTITEYNGNNGISLARALAVPPDDSSLVTIVPMQRNYLMIDNNFSDTGAAVQFYGTSINHVVSGNTATRSIGFIDRGLFYHWFQPNWYNQFLNNKILEGNIYGLGGGNVIPAAAVIGIYGQNKTPNAPPLTRGIILRGNCLANNAQIEIKGGPSTDAPGVVDSIVENNVVANVTPWIIADKGARNTFVRNNKILPSTNAEVCKQ